MQPSEAAADTAEPEVQPAEQNQAVPAEAAIEAAQEELAKAAVSDEAET